MLRNGRYLPNSEVSATFHLSDATSSMKHEALLKSLGATHVIDRTGSEATVVAQVIDKLPGGKTEIVYDAITDDTTPALGAKILKGQGTLLLILPISPDFTPEGIDAHYHIGNAFVQREIGISLFRSLKRLLETGAIKVYHIH